MNEEDPLRSVLQEWEAPEPSAALAIQVRASFRATSRTPPPTLWQRLWSFHISIPAPVFAAVLLLIVAAFWLDWRAAPQRPAPTPATGGYMTRLESAGFQPLPDGEIRVFRSGVKQ